MSLQSTTINTIVTVILFTIVIISNNCIKMLQVSFNIVQIVLTILLTMLEHPWQPQTAQVGFFCEGMVQT